MPDGGAITGPAIAATIGGLFGFAGAKHSADAAQAAAATQVASGDKAAQLMFDLGNKSLAFQQQQWGQAQENMRPFLGYGRGAAEMLGTAMGVTPDYPSSMGGAQPQTGGAPPPSVGSLYGQAPAGVGWASEGKRGPVGGARGGDGGGAGRRSDGQMPMGGQGQPTATVSSLQGNQSSYGGQKVHIRWPSGQEQDIPAYQADQYKALGAEVIT